MPSASASLADEVRQFQSDLRAADIGGPSLESSAAACDAEIVSIEARMAATDSDIQRADGIQAQLESYGSKLGKELELHLADIELTLHRTEGCGQAFFEETLRTRKILDLFDQKALRAEYDSFVLSDTVHEIDRRVEEIVDWLVSGEMDQWKELAAQLEQVESPLAQAVAEQLDARFDYDRSRMLTLLGRTSGDALEIFDMSSESAAVAESARNIATNAIFLALGALVAMGAMVSALQTRTDVVPAMSFAAGLAGAAVALTPYSRRRAKRRLGLRLGALRDQLQRDLRYQVAKEIERSKKKIWEIVEVPLANIRSEHEELAGKRDQLVELKARAATLQERLAAETSNPERTL